MNVKRVMFVVISLITLMSGVMLLVTATSSGSVDTALSSGSQASGKFPTPTPALGLEPPETNGKARAQGPLPTPSQPIETDGKAQADLGARPSDLTPSSSIEEPNHIKLETPTGE